MGSVRAMRRCLLLLSAALLLASCGGDDGGSTSATGMASSTTTSAGASSTTTSAKKEGDHPTLERAGNPRFTLETVLVRGACGNYVTDHFVEVAYGTEQACEQATKAGGTASSIDVRSLETNGDTATATVIPKGGPSSGDKLTVELVNEGGIWKIDSLKSDAPVGP
jgi:hypothetical protein